MPDGNSVRGMDGCQYGEGEGDGDGNEEGRQKCPLFVTDPSDEALTAVASLTEERIS